MPANLDNDTPSVAQATLQTKLYQLGPVNTTRTVALTSTVSVVPATGMPATSIAGSGTGPNDRYVITAPNSIQMEILPYGSGSSGAPFTWQIIGRKELDAGGTGIETYARVMAIGSGTIGGVAGVAGATVGTGGRFAESLYITSDYTPGSGFHVNTSAGVATISFDARGNQWIEMELVKGTGITSMNGLWSAL